MFGVVRTLAVLAALLAAPSSATAQAVRCTIPSAFQNALDGLRAAAANGDFDRWSALKVQLEGVTIGPVVRCADRLAQAAFGLDLIYGPGNESSINPGIGALEVANYDPAEHSGSPFTAERAPAEVYARTQIAYAIGLRELANQLGGATPAAVTPITNTWTENASEDYVRELARTRYQRTLAALRQVAGSHLHMLSGAGGSVEALLGAPADDAVLIALAHCSGLVNVPVLQASEGAIAALKRIATSIRGSRAHALLRCAAAYELQSPGAAALARGRETCAAIPSLTVVSERNRCERHVLDHMARASDWEAVSVHAASLLESIAVTELVGVTVDSLKLARYDLAEVARVGAYAEAQRGRWARALHLTDLRTAISLQNWTRLGLAHDALRANRSSVATPEVLLAVMDSPYGCSVVVVEAGGTGGTRHHLSDEVCTRSGRQRSVTRFRSDWDAYVRDTRHEWNAEAFATEISAPVAAALSGRTGRLTFVYSDWAGSLPLFADVSLLERFESVTGAVYAIPGEGRDQPFVGGDIRIFASPELRYSDLEAQFVRGSHAGRVAAFSTYVASSFPGSFRGARVWHFATHAVTNETITTQSRILLPNGSQLSLSELRFGLRRLTRAETPDLVVLSACDTARSSYATLSPSLANVFLDRGVRWVVASSWPVSDLATALLMAKFYEGLAANMPVARALSAAQLWLGSASFDDIERLIDASGYAVSAEQRNDLNELGEIPFEDPIFWAAFRAYTQ